MAKKKVLDMLGQEIKVDDRVVYLRTAGLKTAYIPLRAIVTEVKSRKRTENDATMYDSPPIIQVTIDCGRIWGIVKVREPKKLTVVNKLGFSKWNLGGVFR